MANRIPKHHIGALRALTGWYANISEALRRTLS